jgi:hypothetical protein
VKKKVRVRRKAACIAGGKFVEGKKVAVEGQSTINRIIRIEKSAKAQRIEAEDSFREDYTSEQKEFVVTEVKIRPNLLLMAFKS